MAPPKKHVNRGPERRSGKDRRKGRETKICSMITTTDVGLKEATLVHGYPVTILMKKNRRSGQKRRSGKDRRKS